MWRNPGHRARWHAWAIGLTYAGRLAGCRVRHGDYFLGVTWPGKAGSSLAPGEGRAG